MLLGCDHQTDVCVVDREWHFGTMHAALIRLCSAVHGHVCTQHRCAHMGSAPLAAISVACSQLQSRSVHCSCGLLLGS
jgi:hypothetical protein